MNIHYRNVFNHAVSALSKGIIPDFTRFKQEFVLAAFQSIFWENEVSIVWIEILQRKIVYASWGAVDCQQIEEDRWPCLPVEGPVSYMKLVDYETNKDIVYFFISPTRAIQRGSPLSDGM